jgi:phage gpG-like protein
MEVTDLAASIGQISQLILKAAEYLDDVKDAPKDRKRLFKEVKSLAALLTGLRNRIEFASSGEPSFRGLRWLGMENGHLDQLKRLMIELTTQLQPTSAMKALGKRPVWTLTKDKTDEVLTTMDRLKASLILSLPKDQS